MRRAVDMGPCPPICPKEHSLIATVGNSGPRSHWGWDLKGLRYMVIAAPLHLAVWTPSQSNFVANSLP